MRLSYLIFILILVLAGAGAWFLSSRSATAPVPPAITTTTPTNATTTEPEQEASTASLTQTILLNGVHLTPLVVSEDSRCPVDVQCIQAGTVRLQTKIEVQEKTETQTLTLGKPFSVAGKTITLTEVVPVKSSKVPLRSADYRFKFSVR